MTRTLPLLLAAALAVPSAARAQLGALPSLEKAARAAPRDIDAQVALGFGYLRAGQLKRAERQLKRAGKLPGAGPELVIRLAQVAIARGDYRAARRTCSRLGTPTGERSAVAHLCMARAFLAWNRSSRALEELEQALQKEPGPLRSEIELVLGEAHRLRGRVAEAERAYGRAKADPRWAAEAELGLGKLYAAVGRAQDAVAALRRALALAPDWPEIQLELGVALGHREEARQLLAAALAGRPSWGEAAVALGEARLAAGETGGAVEAFRAAVAANRRLAAGYAGLGRALLKQRRYAEAERALREALELVPNAAPAVLALADLLAVTERPDEALVQYRLAFDVNPRDPTPLLRGARLALEQGRVNLAGGLLDRLLTVHRDNAAAFALYGQVARARGELDKARAYYQRALAGQGPVDRPRVEQALAELSERGMEVSATTAPRR